MKPLWFIGGMAALAIILAGIGVAAAYPASAADDKIQPVSQNLQTGGCGCSHGDAAGGCKAAGCGAGCTECQGGCGGGCSGGCSK